MNSHHHTRSPSFRLDQTLAQWRQWQCQPRLPAPPTVERELHGGLSNHSFVVKAGADQFVVRLDGIEPRRHGLSRQAEWHALRAAGEAGIAPLPRYFNPQLGAIVVDFVPGDSRQVISSVELAGLLCSIHGLAPGHYKVDLADRVRRYQQRLARDARRGLPATYEARLDDLLSALEEQDTTPRTMTHNDLLPANLVRSQGQLIALDWEYCGLGSPWFDLAVASLGQAMNEEAQAALLTHYLQAAPTAEQNLMLGRYRALARYVELLWHLVESPLEHVDLTMETGLRLIDEEQAA